MNDGNVELPCGVVYLEGDSGVSMTFPCHVTRMDLDYSLERSQTHASAFCFCIRD